MLLRSWINEVYRVETSQGVHILKVFRRGWRAPDEISYEIELMQHLAQFGMFVQQPLSTRAGAHIHVLPAPEGQRSAVLYPMLHGVPPLPPSEEVYYQVGITIAQMHQALDSFVPTHPRRALDVHYLAHEPLTWLEPHLAYRETDRTFLHALMERVEQRLAVLEQTGNLSRGPIHGDATLDNLLRTDTGQIGVYDFDQSGPGWRAYELQGVFAYAWQDQHPGYWEALVAGYTSVLPLSDTDLAAMPCFPVLNQLWCMGFEAHIIARNHGEWIVNQDYFDARIAALRAWSKVHRELDVG